MISNTIKSEIGKASELGISLYEDTPPLQLWEGASLEDKETIIRSVYRQALGNAYVMESERLTVPESQFKNGEITVREFVRQVAQSDFYRSRFFDNCSRYRAIELNFKHLLGRAPESYDEMKLHSQILDEGGYLAEIDFYLDSDEYQDAFGEFIVPYYRGYKTQTGKKMVGFPHFFQLVRGASSSDKNSIYNNRPRLERALLTNTANSVNLPSAYGTYGGLTDIDRLLAEVFKPKTPTQTPAPASTSVRTTTADYQLLQRQYYEQAETIEKLQAQLKGLNATAAVGTWQTTKWQSNNSVTPSSSNLTASSTVVATSSQPPKDFYELQRGVEEQKKAIQALQSNIAQVRSLAAIGQARIDKWQSRTFRG